MPDTTPAPASKVAPRDTGKRETKVPESSEVNGGKEPITRSTEPAAEAAGGKMNPAPRDPSPSSDRLADQVGKAAQEATVASSETATQLLDGALQIASRNIETVVSSTNATLRAAETVTQTAVEYGQRNFRQMSTMMRDLWEVRTFADFVSLQREHTRAVVENLLEETTQLSDQLSRSFGDIIDSVVKQQPDEADVPHRKAA